MRLLIHVRNGEASIRKYGQKFYRNGLGSICAAHHIVRNMEGVKQPIHKPFQFFFLLAVVMCDCFHPLTPKHMLPGCFFCSEKTFF